MKRNILAENMRRFKTKNLTEAHDDYMGGGSLQQPGMSDSPEWKEGYKRRLPKGNPHDYSSWLVGTQADIGDRLNYMSQNVDKIESFLPEISQMIKATQMMLSTIQQKFPVYYKELNYWTYNVVKAHQYTKAHLLAVLSDPQSPKTKDNLRDAAKLYAINAEEAVEANNSDKVMHELDRMLGRTN
jgi:hypothetical protein